jgi:hypothetical protein
MAITLLIGVHFVRTDDAFIEIQRELVEYLRTQLHKEEHTLQEMEKAKEFFPA